MLFYKFIFIKALSSIALSTVILSSVLYIFSIIELLGNSYVFINTLVVGLINTLELLITIPTIIFVLSVIIFWNNIKKTNELLIIRHYMSLKKIIVTFSIFIFFFTYLEINKAFVNNKIGDLKETYLMKSSNNTSIDKVFFIFNNDELVITKLKELNTEINNVKEISVYKFKDNFFINSLHSTNNLINNNKIIMINPKKITSKSINNLDENYEINIKKFGEYFYNNDEKINLYQNSEIKNNKSLLDIVILVLILSTYLSIFLSKKAIQKNASALKYNSIVLLVFTYAFITSQISLEDYNIFFQISVLLTFTFYLYKNLVNE
jgi:hypothetical protein